MPHIYHMVNCWSRGWWVGTSVTYTELIVMFIEPIWDHVLCFVTRSIVMLEEVNSPQHHNTSPAWNVTPNPTICKNLTKWHFPIFTCPVLVSSWFPALHGWKDLLFCYKQLCHGHWEHIYRYSIGWIVQKPDLSPPWLLNNRPQYLQIYLTKHNFT